MSKVAQSDKIRFQALMGDDGFPLYASVEMKDENGKTCRVYKQEMLFDVEDYRKVVTYHHDRSNYHRRMSAGYKTRCKNRFNVQLTLPFDGD